MGVGQGGTHLKRRRDHRKKNLKLCVTLQETGISKYTKSIIYKELLDIENMTTEIKSSP